VKDNGDWWKVEARIIRRLQASYGARGSMAITAVAVRACCHSAAVERFGSALTAALPQLRCESAAVAARAAQLRSCACLYTVNNSRKKE